MTAASSRLAGRAAELRSAFDRAFATALRGDAVSKADLIAIRVGGEACAIRLSEVAGLFADRKITPVSGSKAALLGIAGFRGALLPVYSLAALLRGSASIALTPRARAATPALRWLVVAAAAPLALAFDAFEGHLRVAADAIRPRQANQSAQQFAADFIRTGDIVRPVIALSSAIAALGSLPAAKPSCRSEMS
jgi:chemotaxis signal transduction protein